MAMGFRNVLLGAAILSLLGIAALFFAVNKSLGIAGLGLVLVVPAVMLAWVLRVDDVRGCTPLDRQI